MLSNPPAFPASPPPDSAALESPEFPETPETPQARPDSVSASIAADAPVVWRFEFRGTAFQFFRIWLVNLLLTFATFGIYSAWAKVRVRRYFHGNAFLNGANFDYLASPLSILVARIIVVLLVLGGAAVAGEDLLNVAVHSTLLALLLPWALVRGLAFNARYSSHRGARFAFKKETAAAYALFAPLLALFILPGYVAYFSSAGAAALAALADAFAASFFGLYVALLLVALAAAPWLLRAWHNFKARNHSIGPVQFHLRGPPLRAYLAALWGIPILGLAALVVVIPQFRLATEANIAARGFSAILTAAAIMALVFILVNAKLFHTFWNHLRFSVGGESGKFRADFSSWEFAVKILVVNYIAILLSLGLLYPWAKIRRARFLADRMTLETTESALDKIPGLRRDDESALGEEFEAAEGFDFDVGLV